jgi:hypothetical protein
MGRRLPLDDRLRRVIGLEREARPPGIDHKHVQDRPAIRRLPRHKPSGIRMRGPGQVGANPGFESDKRFVHAASQPPSTTITVPVVKEDASLAR